MWLRPSPNTPRLALWAGLVVACGLAPATHAQTLTVLATMNFGKVEFAGNPLSGNINLGPNGNINYGTNTSGNGSGTGGQIRINGTTGLTVSIRCTQTMTLQRAAGGTVNFTNMRINVTTPTNFASALACRNNLNQNVTTHVLSATPTNNIIYLGGRLTVNGVSVQNGLYQGSISGGSLASLRVVYQ